MSPSLARMLRRLADRLDPPPAPAAVEPGARATVADLRDVQREIARLVAREHIDELFFEAASPELLSVVGRMAHVELAHRDDMWQRLESGAWR